MKKRLLTRVASGLLSLLLLTTMLPLGAGAAQPAGQPVGTREEVHSLALMKPALTVTQGTNQKPTLFSWTTSAGAAGYELKIRNGAGIEVEHLTGLTGSSISLKLTEGVYEAAVAAVDGGSSAVWSSYIPFMVARDTLLALSLTSLPQKTTYVEGEAFNPAGMRITGEFLSGYRAEVTDYTISGFSSVPGTHTVQVTSDGISISFTVTVTQKKLTGISVSKLPNKVNYKEGDPFVPDGMEVTASYNNGQTEKVTGYAVSGFTSTPGTHVVTVTYEGKTATFPVTVTAKVLTGITVTKKPTKLTYKEGEPFDPAGMVVTASYDNGTSAAVTGYTVSGFTSTPGTHVVTVTYGGKTATFNVTVTAKVLTGITVTKKPTKLTYKEGESFDPAGMEVTASYDNGTSAAVTGYTVSGYSSIPGTHTITVTYGGKTATFNVTVTAKVLTGITVTKKPTKLTYKEGEPFEPAGMVVTASYDNGTSVVVTGYTVSGYASTSGTHTITITYGGKTATFDVTVTAKVLTGIAITKQPTKLTYKEGESFDPAGMVVTASYDNGTSAAVTGYTVSGYASTPGTHTVTITYGGKTASFDVTVTAKVLTGITVTKKPTKLTYKEGEPFAPAGMVVTAIYDNGTSAAITGYTVSGYASTPGTHTVTITYGGKTATFDVTVTAKVLTGITVTKKPTKLTYKEGEAFSQTGMEVTANYDNGTSAVVKGYTVSGYSSIPGTHTVTVTYGGKTATFDVTVTAKQLTGITITKLPVKLSYFEGEAFDPAGIEVIAAYDNETTAVVAGYTFSGYASTPGTHTVTVAYGGKTAQFQVTVKKKAVTELVITKLPAKLIYKEGEALDLSGLVLTAYYENNTHEEIKNYQVSGYSPLPGKWAVTLSYDGKSVSFEVVVEEKQLDHIEITRMPNKTEYLEGESLDDTGMVITAYFDNGTSETVTDYELAGYTSQPGTHTVTVNYQGKKAAFPVTVKAKTLLSIVIRSKPDKVVYQKGEAFDPTGMVVAARYDNGEELIIGNYQISGFDGTVAGQQKVVVTYEGMTDFMLVVVKEEAVSRHPEIAASSVMGRFGDTVKVTVSLKDNPGIIGMGLNINYDITKVLLVDVKDMGLLSGFTKSSNAFSDPCRLYWDDSVDTNNTSSGVLVELTFRILMVNPSGEKAPITITYDEYDIVDSNLDPVAFDVTNGAVILKSKLRGDVDGNGVVNSVDLILLRRYVLGWDGLEVEFNNSDIDGSGSINTRDVILLRRHLAGWPNQLFDAPAAEAEPQGTLSFGSASGAAGDTVTVAVNVSGNPGLIAAELPLAYDTTRLQLVGVEDTGILAGGNYMLSAYDRAPYKLYWEDALSKTNNQSDGTIAYLTFRIRDDAPAGDAFIRADTENSIIVDTYLDDVPFQITGGAIAVR